MKIVPKKIYQDFLKKVAPDVIHIHSLMGVHKEFFIVAKEFNIPIIMTTHDYFGLCIKTTFIDKNEENCNCREYLKCANCNYGQGISLRKSYIMQSGLYKTIKNIPIMRVIRKKFRKKINLTKNDVDISIDKQKNYKDLLDYYDSIYNMIDYFHYNSYVAKSVYIKYLNNIKGEVIPITLKDIIDQRKNLQKVKKENVVIGYIGRKEKYKGIDLLMKSLKKIKNDKIKFVCKLYGDDFKEYEKNIDFVKNEGIYSRKKIKEIMENIDLLIIPSIWNETYGLVVLEALSYAVPVITTDRVGSKMLLEKSPFSVIAKPNTNDLYKKIKTILQDNNLNKYREWIINNNEYTFNIEEHTKKIIKMYERNCNGGI